MAIQLTKNAIDLGIVTGNGEKMLSFYKDLLGFRHEGDIPFPMGGTMHRLWCGDSLIKIVVPEPSPSKKAEQGGIPEASGYRYWTISVDNIGQIMSGCKSFGSEVVVPLTEIRSGVTIAIVRDPDGNLVEFLQQS